jgi:hypothetical protein
MSELVTRCKRRVDQENADHIASAEWKALISEAYGELFQTVADAGLQYFEYTSTITTDGSSYYDEPSDHLATVSLDRVIDAAGRRRTLREIMAQERSAWAGRSGSEALVFALVDDRIYLYPTPPSGLTYELLYIPQSPDLSSYDDDDVVDVVTADGEAFLIWGVAVKALAKAERNVQLAMAEREAARQRLLEWAVQRAFNQPRRRYVDEFDASSPAISEGDWRFNR